MPTAKQRIKADHRRRFREAVEELNEVMREVKKYEPKANYYLACETLNLMIGPSHEGTINIRPQRQRVADQADLWGSSGGDW